MKQPKKYLSVITVLMSLVTISCAPSEDAPPAPKTCPYVSGQVNTNAGSTYGGGFSFTVGNGVVGFNNMNLTFSVAYGNVIVDVGNMCLADADFWTGDNVSGAISVIIGHTYIVRSRTIINGVTTYYYSRFVVNSYYDGVVRLTYAQF